MQKNLKFFFDVISPYSYFGFEGLTLQKTVWKTEIQWKPVHFPTIVRNSKNPSLPLRVPVKEKYMHKDLIFNAQYWGLPFRLPKDFTNKMLTTSSVVPQRVLIAAQLRDEKLVEQLARAFWHRFYAYGKPVFTKEEVEEVLRDCRIKGSNELIFASETDEIKSILRSNTDEALEQGCFGVPWYHISDSNGNVIQTVFGSDRLPQIADFLDEPFISPNR